jgi:hypothetical protein
MRAASLIITADRGSLRAYRVQETATRGASLQLVQAFEIPNVNDISRTDHTTAMADRPQRKTEERRRLCGQLASEIAKIVGEFVGEGWSLAAPRSICAKIVDRLTTRIRETKHFRSLQPI